MCGSALVLASSLPKEQNAQTTDAAGAIQRGFPAMKVIVILLFSLVGIAGSYGVAWFGIRVNTFANSRTAFASLTGKPYPTMRSR